MTSVSCCVALILAAGATMGDVPTNLAAGKPCVFSVATNYDPCKDSRDAWQLTDGITCASLGKTGLIWVEPECVGWCHVWGSRTISVDLGSVQSIGGFACNMAAGHGGVTWPTSINVYVSEDGASWRFVGDLWAKSTAATGVPKSDAYSVYRVACEKMPCRGRHVLFLIEQEPFTFMDELEVLPGPADAPMPTGPAFADPLNHHFANLVRRHMRLDVKRIWANSKGLPEDDRAALQRDLRAAMTHGNDFVVTDHRTFETPIPLCAAHAEVFAANARLLRAAGIAQPTLWANNRWENLDPLTVPTKEACEDRPLQLEMMRGERRAVSVNIANPGVKPLDCRVTVVGLPATAHPELAEVLFTETKVFKSVSSGLRYEPEGKPLTFCVPAGASKQVWLSLAKPTLAAGTYEGKIVFALANGTRLERKLALRIHDFDMPAHPRLHLCGWDYSDCHVDDPAKFAIHRAQMRRMGCDTPFATNRVLPANPVFNEDGSLANANQLDYGRWDKWLPLWPDARQFGIFVSPPKAAFYGEQLGTPRFERMVRDYYRAFYDHAKKTGLGNRRIILHLIDEPSDCMPPSTPAVIVAWAKAIHAAVPELAVYENPNYHQPEKIDQAMFDLSDILCPQMWEMHLGGCVKYFADQAKKGKEVWVYSCNGPSRDLSPVSYYLAQAYLAFQIGGCGSGFWEFSTGGNAGSWRAYAQNGHEYTPYFAGPSRAMPAKQSEAILESTEDFEYMALLKEAIAAAKANGCDVSRAERVLAEAPRRVLGQDLSGAEDYQLKESERWNVFSHHDAAEISRLAVLRELAALKAARR